MSSKGMDASEVDPEESEELEELELSQGTSNVAKGTLLDGIANVSGLVLLVDL